MASNKNDSDAASRGRSKPRLTYVIGNLDRILRRRMAEALEPKGLTIAQFTALSVLEARGESSNAQLAERSFITPQSANEVVSVMVARGWTRRRADPKHGRIVLLELTDEGRKVLAESAILVRTIEKQMLSGFGVDGAASVQNMLELCVRNLSG